MRRAVLVGIDHYENFGDLGGCANDARALEAVLRFNDDAGPTQNFQCDTLTTDDGPVTLDALRQRIDQCFSTEPDVALFYFAGHGAEANGSDVTLCVSDGTSTSPGVSLSEVMTKIAASNIRHKIVILDCCYSGGAGGVPQLGANMMALLPKGTTILAASRGDEVSMEADGGGVFTTQLIAALEGGAADVTGQVTSASVYAYLDRSFGAFDQRPVLRANVDRLQPLRQCAPTVTLAEIRTLAATFPDVDVELPLDRSFEPTAEPRNPDNETLFKVLQDCRAAKLVVPVGEEHMYWAAMNSKSCRLTREGQHYCRRIHLGIL